jgi:hypothetical protein
MAPHLDLEEGVLRIGAKKRLVILMPHGLLITSRKSSAQIIMSRHVPGFLTPAGSEPDAPVKPLEKPGG